MVARLAVITIHIDPEIHLGPITLAWHGITIALGLLAGLLVGVAWARRHGLPPDPLYTLVGLAALGGIVGSRIFYVAEHGGPLIGTRGFTFFGGLILAALLCAGYVWREGLDLRYLDAAALGLPLGVAVGRIGDVINGEHYGEQSDFFLAVRNAHPNAETPNPALAYQNGGLYEVLVALVILAIVWPLRNRLRRPGQLPLLVVGLFAVGRFFVQFIRVGDPELALGLSDAQWTSLVLVLGAVVGWLILTWRAA